MTNKPPLDELLPCPFCGGEAKLWDGDWANNGHGIACQNHKCGIIVDPSFIDPIDNETSQQYAIRAWNTRAANSQEADKDVEELIKDYSMLFGWELKELGWYRVHKNDIEKGLRAFARDIAAQQPPRDDRLREALEKIRIITCISPAITDTVWVSKDGECAETLVDFICNTLGDDWDYSDFMNNGGYEQALQQGAK